MTVGEVIRAARLAKGLSARRLSLEAGLSESVVGKLEAGNMQPSLHVFASIVCKLDLSPLEVVFLVRLAGGQVPVSG